MSRPTATASTLFSKASSTLRSLASRPFSLTSSRASAAPATTTNTTPSFSQSTPPFTMGSLDKKSSNVSASALLEMAEMRRTYYQLTKDLTIPTSRIDEIVNKTTLETPSSFNSQSNRVIVLHGEEHEKFWAIAEAGLKAVVPAESWQPTADRLARFNAAAGTILFFDDMETVEGMQAKFPLYADKFPGWASQSNGMQQWMIWTALELEGLGANLQHYSPLVDEGVSKTWNVPKSWKLNAQMVFGGRGAPADPKEFLPLETRVKVYGA